MLPFEEFELSGGQSTEGSTQQTDFDSMETLPAEQAEVEHVEDVAVLQQSQAEQVEDVAVVLQQSQAEQVEDVAVLQQLEDEDHVSCVV